MMEKDIFDFIEAFHDSDDYATIMSGRNYRIGPKSREEIIACAARIASDYCDAQIKAYHRWMTTGRLP